MKKIVSFLIVLLVCFCFNSAAYAVGECFTVKYVDASDNQYVVDSTEIPQFNPPVPAQNNPDLGAGNIILGTPETGNHSEFTVPITLPSYTTDGEYRYSITQIPGETAGVDYDNETIVFRVLVRYDDAGNIAILDTGVGFSGEDKKVGFSNTFRSGSLTVMHTVNGTSQDREKQFQVTFSFADPGGKTVPDIIRYTVQPEVGNATGGTVTDTSGKAKTVTLLLKHNSTVTFDNIPAGVNYTVTQKTLNGFNDPVIEPAAGSITAGQTVSTSVTNSPISSLSTGVLFQNTGALIILAVAVVGLLLLLFRRKRKDY